MLFCTKRRVGQEDGQARNGAGRDVHGKPASSSSGKRMSEEAGRKEAT